MNFLRLLCVIMAVGMCAAACSKTKQTTSTPVTAAKAPSPTNKTPDEFAAAATFYKKECSECHANTGEGGTAKVEGKTIKVPPLRSGHALDHSDEDFTKQIQKGGDGMPAFEKKMTPAEIQQMIRFIRKDFQGK